VSHRSSHVIEQVHIHLIAAANTIARTGRSPDDMEMTELPEALELFSAEIGLEQLQRSRLGMPECKTLLPERRK